MTGHATENLAQRLGRLERQNHRLRLYVAVLAAILGAILVIGQTSPDKSAQALIEAREFVLVDEAGKLRACLGLTEGQPLLTFYRDTGEVAVDLGLSGRVPTLALSEKSPNKANVRLSVEDMADLAISDYDGKRRVWLTLAEGEEPNLLMVDRTAEVAASLTVGSEGSSLVLRKDGAITTVLGNGKNWSYLLFKEGHKTRAEVGLANGQPQIRLTGKDGRSLFDAP